MTFKKIVLGFIMGNLLLQSAVGFTASKDIDVYLGDQKVSIQPMPEVRGNTLYIPFGQVAKLLKCSIEWKDSKVYLHTPKGLAVFELDELSYTLNDMQHPMALPVYAKDNRVMMPLRLVSALLEHVVTYDGTVRIEEMPSEEAIHMPEPAYLTSKEKISYDGKWALVNPHGFAYVKDLKNQKYRLIAENLTRELTYTFAQGDKIIFLEAFNGENSRLVVMDLREMKRIKTIEKVYDFTLDYLTGKLYFACSGNTTNQYGCYDILSKKESKISSDVYNQNYRFSSAYSISGTRGAYVDNSEINLWVRTSASSKPFLLEPSVLTYFFGGNDKLFYVPYEDKDHQSLYVYDFLLGKKSLVFEFAEAHERFKEGIRLFKIPVLDGTWQYKKVDLTTGELTAIDLEEFEKLK